jgi:predicted GTPase
MKHIGINDWIGDYNSKGICDINKCCCSVDGMKFKNVSTELKLIFKAVGYNCSVSVSTENTYGINDTSKDTINIAAVGRFKITTSGELEVLLEQVLILAIFYYSN